MSLISRNPDGVAYVHRAHSKDLLAWLGYEGVNQDVIHEPGANTYFLVAGMHVTTRKLVLGGKK